MEDKGGLLEVGDAVRYSTSGKEFRCLATPTILWESGQVKSGQVMSGWKEGSVFCETKPLP